MELTTFRLPFRGASFDAALSIYAGQLGQVGDIVMYTATARRIKELFPRSTLTFAVSNRYRQAGDLVAGLPYVDRVFVTELYFERLTDANREAWEAGWPVDLRGDDEVEEERRHDIVLDPRARHRRPRWWEYGHQVAEVAHKVGVPGPMDLATDIAIPKGTTVPEDARGKVALHNDPATDAVKAWPWESVRKLVCRLGPERFVLLGSPGPQVDGTLDLRGQTTLAEAAAVIRDSICYVGIDSGLMWVAGSLGVRAIGLYGTSYIPAYASIYPKNRNAVYLQAEGSLDLISIDEVASHVAAQFG